MLKYLLLLVAVYGMTHSLPRPEPQLGLAQPKTPASTEKLTPLIPAPLPALTLPRIAVPLAPIAPLAYAYVAPVKIAAVPSTYTVEQHGYTITY